MVLQSRLFNNIGIFLPPFQRVEISLYIIDRVTAVLFLMLQNIILSILGQVKRCFQWLIGENVDIFNHP